MEITGKNCSLWRRHLAFRILIGCFFVFALAALAQFAFGSFPVVAQQQGNHPETWAWMEIELDAPGRAEVRIYLHPTPHDSAVIVGEIKKALGCQSLESAQSPEQDEEQDESELAAESEQRWSRDLWCNGTMLRKGLAAGGIFDPAPLLPEARSRGLQALEVTIEHYGPWALSLQAPPPWVEGSVDDKFLVPVDASPGSAIRMRLGYSRHDLAGIILPALALLLLPLPFMFWIRRVLLREADAAGPSPPWFGYWRFLQWNMLGVFLLWFTTIRFLKLGPFLRFVFDISSPNRTTVLEAACYATLIFLPPMVVNLICTVLFHPVFGRLHGVEWSKREVFQQAIWTQMASLVPLALIVAAFGVFSGENMKLVALTLSAALFFRILGARRLNTVTNRIVPASLIVAVFVLGAFTVLPMLDQTVVALALLAVLLAELLAWILGLRRLLTVYREPRALRSGELRDRAFALAEQARAKLKQLYVLPTTKAPTANVCARQGKAIVLTDCLLEHLSRREMDALLAHELAHLKRRHPILLPLPLIVAVGLGYLEAEMGTLVSGLPHGTLFPICMVIGVAMSLLLARHFARAADAAAVKLTNDPESLISALAKLTTLNRMPLHWDRPQNTLMTHPSTLRCARRIARGAGIPADRLTHILNSPETPSDRYAMPTR